MRKINFPSKTDKQVVVINHKLMTEHENVSTGAVERVVLNKTDFNNVKLQVFQHINSNIGKFRNMLQPLVESAVDNAEVDSITW